MNLEEEILKLLRREGAVTVYRIAKEFGLTYGRAQWYIGKLQRRGLIYTVRIGSKRYAALKDVDVLQKVTVKDVLDELMRAISTYAEPEMTLQEALERLEAKAPNLAEALRLIAQLR
jgi:DNA-binding Lrp family transcriptional regulator